MAAHRAVMPPTVRSPATRRVNRIALGLTGLLLFAGGGAGLAAGFGVFGSTVRHRTVFGGLADFADDHSWVRVLAGVAGLVAAGLGLLWLLVQGRSNRLGELDLSDRPGEAGTDVEGRTTVAARAVTDAVRAEITGYPGVRDASARLVTERGSSTLLVFTALDGRAGMNEVRARIQTGAVRHAREALEDPELPARLELRMAERFNRSIH